MKNHSILFYSSICPLCRILSRRKVKDVYCLALLGYLATLWTAIRDTHERYAGA